MLDHWLSAGEIAKHLGIIKYTENTWNARKGMLTHRMGRLCKSKWLDNETWVKSPTANEREAGDQP